MAADMTNTIMDYLVARVPEYMNAGYEDLTELEREMEPLYLRTMIKGPLNDDPTLRAFYLQVTPDTTMQDQDDHWRMPVTSIRRGKLGIHQEHPMPEVGGGYKFINFFLIQGWLPMYGNREAAHLAGGEGMRRLERALARMNTGQLFWGIETDDGMETTNAGFPQVFGNDGMHYELKGGENTWYPLLTCRFHIFSEVRREYYAP